MENLRRVTTTATFWGYRGLPLCIGFTVFVFINTTMLSKWFFIARTQLYKVCKSNFCLTFQINYKDMNNQQRKVVLLLGLWATSCSRKSFHRSSSNRWSSGPKSPKCPSQESPIEVDPSTSCSSYWDTWKQLRNSWNRSMWSNWHWSVES